MSMKEIAQLLFQLSKVHTVTRIYKFIDPDYLVYEDARRGYSIEDILDRYYRRLYGYMKVVGNVFLIEGVNFIWNCIVNGSCSPPFDNANACIGVGDGTTAEDPSQTGLQGTNKYYKHMDTGYTTITDNKITFRSTFGADEANFHWYEWTVANGPGDNYTNLNRKVEDLGVKSSGSTWILEVTLAIQ